MEYLYNKFDEDKDEFDYHMEVSFVEIYNETIIDLLSDENIPQPTGGLKLLENEKNRVSIAGVTLKRPKTVDEVMDLVMQGNARRATSFTHSNAVSSRSHAVLQVNIGRVSHGTEVDFAQQVVKQCVTSATLSIIDLAGSERAAATKNIGARMKEGAKINQSLLALSSCISALCEKSVRGARPFVPYRNSKMTRLLKFSLGGNCRTAMIVCISPSSKDLEDTHNTLQWANRAKDVSTKISRNTEGVPVRVQQYLDRIAAQERKIKELEAERNARPKQTESAAVVQRRERDREEVRQALDGLDAEVDAHRSVIDEGAEKRALWDVSQLTVTALLQRIQDLQTEINTRGAALVERDTAYLRSRVDDEKSKFHGNTHVLRMVQREVQRTKTIEKHIENVSSRSFDDLPPVESEGLKTALDMKRREVDLGVYAAREKGYRAMHRHHANMSAITQHHIYSQKENLTTMMEAMLAAEGTAASFVSQLRIEIARSETVLSTAHGHLPPIIDALPPPVSFKDVEAFILPPTPAPQRATSMSFPPPRPDLLSPSKHQSMPPVFGKPSPASSSSLASQGDMSALARSVFQDPPVNKAVARVRGLPVQASPRRKAPGTPGKKILFKRSALKSTSTGNLPRPAGKTMRFRSENSLTEEKIMSDVQTGSSSEASPGNDSNSSEWDNMADEEEDSLSALKPMVIIPPKPRLGLPGRSSLAPPPAPVSAPIRPVPVIGARPSVFTGPSLATTAPTAPAGNDWRAARARDIQNPFLLGTVNEEGQAQGSPSGPGNTSKIGSMGPPARGPLGESRMNPIASSSSSRLSMPTAASAAKQVNGDVSLAMVSARESQRRDSSAHLTRTQRINATSQYRRPSLAPSKDRDHSSEAILPPCLRPLGSSTLGQPTKRRDSMAPPTIPMRTGPGPRDSISASTSLSARGGLKSRASVADFGSKLGNSTSLSSRPSVGNLRAGGGMPGWK